MQLRIYSRLYIFHHGSKIPVFQSGSDHSHGLQVLALYFRITGIDLVQWPGMLLDLISQKAEKSASLKYLIW